MNSHWNFFAKMDESAVKSALLDGAAILVIGPDQLSKVSDETEGDSEKNLLSLDKEAIDDSYDMVEREMIEDPPEPLLEQTLDIVRTGLRLHKSDRLLLKN